MLKIAIVDDEINFIETLTKSITEICKKLDLKILIDKYSNGYDILENYKKFHLIFLDIEMPSIDGIAAAKRINELKGSTEIPFFVFVTSHDELVFDALKSFPYSFIRKCDIKDGNCLYELLMKITKLFDEKCRTIVIRTGRQDVVLKVTDIIYLEKSKNYVIYHTCDQEYKVRGDMNTELKKIFDYGFIRLHIGYAVNNRLIQYISNDKVLLKNNISVPINKKYREEAKNIFFKWLGDVNA